MERNEEL